MKYLIIILAVILNLTFLAQKKEGKYVKIIGNTPKMKGKTIYINSFKNNKMLALDSSLINKKGKFKLKVKIKDPKDFYSLSLSENDYTLLILDSSNTSKKIIFTSNYSQIRERDYNIVGSEESKDISEFTSIINSFQRELESAEKEIKEQNIDNKETKLQEKQQELYKNFIKKRNKFVENNPYSLALITTTSYFNPQTEMEWLKKIEKGFSESIPNSKYHTAIKSQIQQIESAKKAQQKSSQQAQQDPNIGKQFKELNFKNPEGKIISMESLKGKYVLVDFWASWCRPCRMENPHVVNLYNKYKEKGFTVYGVSLDTDKNRWINAIKQDGLIWDNHVSDLKGWKTEAIKLYNFRGIPYTMLVDKEGKIISTKLRGKQLEQKLQSIFGF